MSEEIVVGFPDTRVFANEGDLFGGFGGAARSVEMKLHSTDTTALKTAAVQGRKLLERTFPGANVQSFPNSDVQAPELRPSPTIAASPSRLGPRIARHGRASARRWRVARRILRRPDAAPVILRANIGETPEELERAPLITPSGETVSLGELVTLQTAVAAEQIRRIDHHRTVTLTIDPPQTLSLEDMLAKIQSDIVPSLRSQLPPDANIKLAGSADRLDAIISTMGTNFLLALLVLFMLMAAMFAHCVTLRSSC